MSVHRTRCFPVSKLKENRFMFPSSPERRVREGYSLGLRPLLIVFAFLFCAVAAAENAFAANFVVTRTDDRNTTCVSGGDCSLREAINAANASLAVNDT